MLGHRTSPEKFTDGWIGSDGLAVFLSPFRVLAIDWSISARPTLKTAVVGYTNTMPFLFKK
jgi:hypothetical protein